MQSMDYPEPITIGSVSIRVRTNGSIQLRWTYAGDRREPTIGKYTPERWQFAIAAATKLNAELSVNVFDPTLERYDLAKPKIVPINESVIVLPKEPTIKDVWDFYCTAKDSSVPNSTKEKHWKPVSKILTNGSKHLALNDTFKLIISAKDIYADGTIDKALKLLRAACNFAIEAKQIADNPYTEKAWDLLDLSDDDGDYTRKAFSRKEIEKILLAFETNCLVSKYSKHDHSYYANFVRFRSLTGCRPEESIALTWKDYKAQDGKKYIVFSKAYSHGEIRKTKNGKIRIFPCNSQLIELIESIPKTGSDLIFPSREGKYISSTNFSRRYWNPIVSKLYELEFLSQYLPFYNLRHSFITELARNGFDIATIAAWAGNSEQTILKHYFAVNHEIIPPTL